MPCSLPLSHSSPFSLPHHSRLMSEQGRYSLGTPDLGPNCSDALATRRPTGATEVSTKAAMPIIYHTEVRSQLWLHKSNAALLDAQVQQRDALKHRARAAQLAAANAGLMPDPADEPLTPEQQLRVAMMLKHEEAVMRDDQNRSDGVLVMYSLEIPHDRSAAFLQPLSQAGHPFDCQPRAPCSVNVPAPPEIEYEELQHRGGHPCRAD